MKKEKSFLMLISSMIIFGTIGIFKKYIPLPSASVAMFRGFIGAVFLIAVMIITKKKISFEAIKKNLLFLCLSGAAMGFNWILLFEAYNYTTVATATLCYYMAPIFVIIASPLILKEKLSAKKAVCIVVALVGMVFVSGVFESGFSGISETKGVLLGLGAAVFYSVLVFLNKKISGISAYDKTAVQLLSAAAVLLIYIACTGEIAEIKFDGTVSIIMLAIICVIHTGLAYFLYFGSMDGLSAQTIAIFSYIDPVVAVLLSALILHEALTVYTVIGAVLILGSAIFSEIKN